MTAKELFENVVPRNLNKPGLPEAVFHFQVDGDAWTVDIANKTCKPGLTGVADCGIAISNDDLQVLLGNPSVAMSLYFTGKHSNNSHTPRRPGQSTLAP